MDNSVVIKSSKNGITVLLDDKLQFDELIEKVKEKFTNASKFFEAANLAVSFEGRELSTEEEKEVLNAIAEVSELNIVCVVNKDENTNEVFKEAVEKALSEAAKEQPAPDFKNINGDSSCQFYKGTLRSGQIFESDSSVVILGDVNPGGKVISKGNVIVLGSLRGNIFAGASGNENAFVVALEMNPMQIKIADVIARSSDSAVKTKNKNKSVQPKIAYIYDSNIYVEDLEQDVWADINV
ncbi:MAG: septum site-determining protein MinC [Lachnospira sp.]|nr:septum site-determining protein MinC [Lachnospira sp.]